MVIAFRKITINAQFVISWYHYTFRQSIILKFEIIFSYKLSAINYQQNLFVNSIVTNFIVSTLSDFVKFIRLRFQKLKLTIYNLAKALHDGISQKKRRGYRAISNWKFRFRMTPKKLLYKIVYFKEFRTEVTQMQNSLHANIRFW